MWLGKFGVGLLLLLAGGDAAIAAKVAVFEIEIVRGQDIGFSPDYIQKEEQRIVRTSEHLRGLFRRAGFEVLDIGPVAARAARFHLQSCGNCADDLAAEIGADYAVTAEVHRVSTLILSLQVVVRSLSRLQPVVSTRIDLRGNTDEAWRRATEYVFQNRIAPAMAVAEGQ